MKFTRSRFLVVVVLLAGLFGLSGCVPAAPSIPTSTTTTSIAPTTTTTLPRTTTSSSTTTSTTTIPPTTTTTTLPGQNQIVSLGEVGPTETGCERTDISGSDADAFSGRIFEVCKDTARGMYKMVQLVVPGPGRLPVKLSEQDLLPIPPGDEWVPKIELIEGRNRIFVFMGSELRIFLASNGQPAGSVTLPLSGRYSVDSVSYLCGGSSNSLDYVSGRVVIAADSNRKVLVLDGSTGATIVSRVFTNERPLIASYSMRSGNIAMTSIEVSGEGYGTYLGVTHEYVLNPDTLETVFSSAMTRSATGWLTMHKSCAGTDDLLQTEASAMATTFGTGTGTISNRLPNSRYYSTNGPAIAYANDLVVRTIATGITIEGFDYSLKAFIDYSVGNRIAYLADITWQESGRMNLFWNDGTISVYCINGHSNC